MSIEGSFRILTLSDIRGHLQAVQELHDETYGGGTADVVVHTGNFGFWTRETVDRCNNSQYLKQIIAFSNVLEESVVEKLNDLSTIDSKTKDGDEDLDHIKEILGQDVALSEIEEYMHGHKRLPCPVYTIFGPLDDPAVVHKFQTGEYSIPNLYVIDHLTNYEIPTPLETQPNIRLYGIGGTLKIQSLFDNGSLEDDRYAGKLGDLWITLAQIAELYHTISNLENKKTINIFITHIPVVRTPLLEHLAIMMHADFTLSQGLHFRYPVMTNGMSVIDGTRGSSGFIDNYRSKFSRLRMILGELWTAIKDDVMAILEYDQRHEIRELLETGLSIFDKIPVSVTDFGDTITPLTLTDKKEEHDSHRRLLKQVNDRYFQAYYNLWHFNLCDHVFPHSKAYNIMVFELNTAGNFSLSYCNSQGFDFNHKLENDTDTRTDIDDGKYSLDDSFTESGQESGRKKLVISSRESSFYKLSETSSDNGESDTFYNTSDSYINDDGSTRDDSFNSRSSDDTYKNPYNRRPKKSRGKPRGNFRGSYRGRGRGPSRP